MSNGIIRRWSGLGGLGYGCPLNSPPRWNRLPPAGSRFEDWCTPEVFYEASRRIAEGSGDAPGVDGHRPSQFSHRERWDISRVLSAHFRAGDPYRPREYRWVRIPKPSGGHRLLAIPCYLDRIVATMVGWHLTALIEPLLRNCVWGFRPRRNAGMMITSFRRAVQQENLLVAQHLDIRQAFDNLRHADVLGYLEGLSVDPRLQRVIDAFITEGGENRTGVGAPQGLACSPPLLNLVLHYLLDLLFVRRSSPLPVWYGRYADDLLIAGRTVDDVLTARRELQDRLAQAGLDLKHPHERPRDLRRPGMGVEVLGYRLAWDPASATMVARPSEEAWRRLAQARRECRDEPEPVRAQRQLLEGWLASWAGLSVQEQTNLENEIVRRCGNRERRNAAA